MKVKFSKNIKVADFYKTLKMKDKLIDVYNTYTPNFYVAKTKRDYHLLVSTDKKHFVFVAKTHLGIVDEVIDYLKKNRQDELVSKMEQAFYE